MVKESFWNGFEKKAILKAIVKPLLSAGANLGKLIAKKPVAALNTAATGTFGVVAASEASTIAAKSRRANQLIGGMRTPGGTF